MEPGYQSHQKMVAIPRSWELDYRKMSARGSMRPGRTSSPERESFWRAVCSRFEAKAKSGARTVLGPRLIMNPAPAPKKIPNSYFSTKFPRRVVGGDQFGRDHRSGSSVFVGDALDGGHEVV